MVRCGGQDGSGGRDCLSGLVDIELGECSRMALLGFHFGTDEATKCFTRQIMTYTCKPQTYSIEKARDRSRYKPFDDRDERIRKGVD